MSIKIKVRVCVAVAYVWALGAAENMCSDETSPMQAKLQGSKNMGGPTSSDESSLLQVQLADTSRVQVDKDQANGYTKIASQQKCNDRWGYLKALRTRTGSAYECFRECQDEPGCKYFSAKTDAKWCKLFSQCMRKSDTSFATYKMKASWYTKRSDQYSYDCDKEKKLYPKDYPAHTSALTPQQAAVFCDNLGQTCGGFVFVTTAAQKERDELENTTRDDIASAYYCKPGGIKQFTHHDGGAVAYEK
jgi:hypothetical protein